MVNYYGYTVLGVFIPALFITLSVFIIPFLVKIQTLFDQENFFTKIPFRTFVASALKMMYGHDLLEEDDEITLYRRNLGNLQTYAVVSGIQCQFVMVMCVVAASTLGFWSNFLLDEKDSCDDKFDCFAFIGVAFFSGNLVQSNPLENCTEFENGSYNIRCLKFSLDYADALGKAGGVLVVSKVFASINISLWIALTTPMKEITRKKILIITYFVVVFVGVIVLSVFFQKIFGTLSDLLKFTAYFLALFGVLMISGPFFVLTSEKERPREPAT